MAPQITKPDNGWIDWNDYVLTHMTGSIDYLSVQHRYATEALGNDRSFRMMCLGLDLDQKIETVKALILKAMTKQDQHDRSISHLMNGPEGLVTASLYH